MINVEKVIRILGYIVYTALWSPIIVLFIIFMPIVYGGMQIRAGKPIGEAISMYHDSLMDGIRHDVNFIKTGEW